MTPDQVHSASARSKQWFIELYRSFVRVFAAVSRSPCSLGDGFYSLGTALSGHKISLVQVNKKRSSDLWSLFINIDSVGAEN